MRIDGSPRAFFSALSLVCTLAVSCGESNPQTGTNTNWLSACVTDVDCGQKANCICGSCTVNCNTTTDCTNFGGTCSLELAAATQCGTVEALPLCLGSCSSDRDCSEGQTCVSQSCVQVTTRTTCNGASSELACGTFEDDTLDGWVPAVDAAATLGVVTSPVFEGTASLRSQWPGRAIAEQSFEPILNGSVYGRFWLRLDTPFSAAHLAQLDGDTGETALRLVTDGTNALVETVDGAVAGKTVILTASQWHCVRFAVTLSDTNGTLRVWLDELLMVDAQGRDTLPEAGITGFQVGVGWANGDTTLYVDNALLSNEPVSCI